MLNTQMTIKKMDKKKLDFLKRQKIKHVNLLNYFGFLFLVIALGTDILGRTAYASVWITGI